MARRLAFLIGNQNFLPNSDLSPLKGPKNDVSALTRLLGDASRGGFEILKFIDEDSHKIIPEIDNALNEARPDDLILIYYSGHGVLDRNGRLCLATANTTRKSLISTSIPTRILKDLVDQSDCQQNILLLDCCYSGAVESGLKGAVGEELRIVEQARGFYIITASTATQVAKEKTTGLNDVTMGRFTAALVEGLETGAADIHRKGKILLSDIRTYLNQTVTGQTPQFFDRNASGDPLISLSPATTGPLLDAGVLQDLEAPEWHRRRGAVEALATILKEGQPLQRNAAKAALERCFANERDFVVKSQISKILNHESILEANFGDSDEKIGILSVISQILLCTIMPFIPTISAVWWFMNHIFMDELQAKYIILAALGATIMLFYTQWRMWEFRYLLNIRLWTNKFFRFVVLSEYITIISFFVVRIVVHKSQ